MKDYTFGFFFYASVVWIWIHSFLGTFLPRFLLSNLRLALMLMSVWSLAVFNRICVLLCVSGSLCLQASACCSCVVLLWGIWSWWIVEVWGLRIRIHVVGIGLKRIGTVDWEDWFCVSGIWWYGLMLVCVIGLRLRRFGWVLSSLDWSVLMRVVMNCGNWFCVKVMRMTILNEIVRWILAIEIGNFVRVTGAAGCEEW